MADSEESHELKPLKTAFAELEEDVVAGRGKEGATMAALERMTREIGLLGLFGKNEDIAELPTSSLNFLLLPALLGAMSQQGATQPLERLEALKKAQVYFRDYLIRVREYGLSTDVVPEELKQTWEEEEAAPSTGRGGGDGEGRRDLAAQEAARTRKIAQYKERSELEKRVSATSESVRSGARIDEESLREHLLEKLRWWTLRALSELDLLAQEMPMLEMMAARAGEPEATARARQPPRPFRPLILTRDSVQKTVFGKGYPSAYTMTVREYMDMTHHLHNPAAADPAAADDEKDEDIDRLRALDEYRDYHRTGWGNTHNKG